MVEAVLLVDDTTLNFGYDVYKNSAGLLRSVAGISGHGAISQLLDIDGIYIWNKVK